MPTDAEMPSLRAVAARPKKTLCKPLLATYVAVGEMLNDDP
ncbi:MAG: hypothetical protein R2854_10860 [Caldilineaceae bacterium]